jgi:hypothetical protein
MNTAHSTTYYRVRTAVRCTFLVAVATLSFIVGKALATDPLTYECDHSAVIVQSGDTLWSLAEKYCTGHIGQATDDLVKKYGTDVQVGDIVAMTGSKK